MPVTYFKEDILPQIVSPESLEAKAVAISGSITLLGVIQLSWDISGDSISVSATLTTPLGNVNLGSVTLDPQHTTAQLGGGLLGFKAEVDLTFDYSQLILQITATACAPFAGCKQGSTTITV
jgi:hypothetical protein